MLIIGSFCQRSILDFLESNGFVNRKNNDYFHPNLGIILEDLHDENVLTIDGTLQFIDAIFYLNPDFFKSLTIHFLSKTFFKPQGLISAFFLFHTNTVLYKFLGQQIYPFY